MMPEPDSSHYHKCATTSQMTNNKSEYTNVRLEKDVHTRLKLQGTSGDSLSDVVRGLLDEREQKHQKKTISEVVD
jgi:hypothetical protein